MTIYGSIEGGDIYFGTRLRSDAWDNSSDIDKTKALSMATRAIEKLNFSGDRAVSTQELQFPRGADISVPEPIEFAAYELALMYLQGYDIQSLRDDARVQSDKFAEAATTYRPALVEDHLLAGIISQEAWDLLKPYLRDPYQINFCRV